MNAEESKKAAKAKRRSKNKTKRKPETTPDEPVSKRHQPTSQKPTPIKFTNPPLDDGGECLYVPFGDTKPSTAEKKEPKKAPKKAANNPARDKWLKKVEQEKAADLAEQARETDPTPKTTEDFKMLLASNPNNSYVWCQFMAFWLCRGEVTKARQVAELALQTLNHRQEQEIYNVWTAFMSLEDQHGTMESLNAVFRRAILNVDDPKKLWFYMIDLLFKGQKYMEVHQLYKEMLRRFKTEIDVWAAFYRWCVKLRKDDDLKQIPRNALNSLTKDRHIAMMARFGTIDMKEGNVERGRSIFEGLLSKYPKRGDIWNVYIDMEKLLLQREKAGHKKLRAIFLRVTTLNLSPKTMQGFFTRFMEFEKEHGSQAQQEAVRERAMAYVEQKCSAT